MSGKKLWVKLLYVWLPHLFGHLPHGVFGIPFPSFGLILLLEWWGLPCTSCYLLDTVITGALYNVMVSCLLLPVLICWTKVRTEEELVTGLTVSSGQQGRQRPQKEDIIGEERACSRFSSSPVSYKVADEAGWCLPHHHCVCT